MNALDVTIEAAVPPVDGTKPMYYQEGTLVRITGGQWSGWNALVIESLGARTYSLFLLLTDHRGTHRQGVIVCDHTEFEAL